LPDEFPIAAIIEKFYLNRESNVRPIMLNKSSAYREDSKSEENSKSEEDSKGREIIKDKGKAPAT